MSLRDDPVLAKTYAGILAASNAVVSRMDTGRPPPLAPNAPGFRPSSLSEVARLVADADPLHRAIAGSLCHAYEAVNGKVKSGGYSEKILLRNGTLDAAYAKKFLQEDVLDASAQKLLGKGKPDAYAEKFLRKGNLDAYQPDPSLRPGLGRARDLLANLCPTAATVVSPDLQIVTKFGQGESNISSAKIDDYQLLLSENSAVQVLGRSNPLNWQKGAPDLFQSVVPARRVRERPNQTWVRDPHRDPVNWQQAASKVDYIYESAIWPWSETVTLGVDNVLAISGFESSYLDPREKVLRYTYALERCMRSDYGVITEELSGLDIDGGHVDGRAVPVAKLSEPDASKLNVDDLRRLVTKHELDERLGHGCEARLEPDKKRQLAQEILGQIGAKKEYEPWLLTISSSKRLRYTVPQSLPVDLWASLTWTAPALLYTFINRAVCQLPQFVEEEARTGKTVELIKGTAP